MYDKNHNSSLNLNKFLKKIVLKKKYIQKLSEKMYLLENIKEHNFKTLNSSLFPKNSAKQDTLILYIVDITFSRSNTLLHVMDSSGTLKFFCSAGELSYSGKSKKSRVSVLTSMIRILIQKLKFLQGKPIALHLKNFGFKKFWIVKKLKKKFFIRIVRSFNLYPHNGCRKKKIRRKKFKKKIIRRNG